MRFTQEIRRYLEDCLRNPNPPHRPYIPLRVKKLGPALYAIADSYEEIDIFYGRHTWSGPRDSDDPHGPMGENIAILSGAGFTPEPKTFDEAGECVRRVLSPRTRYATFVDRPECQVTLTALAEIFPD